MNNKSAKYIIKKFSVIGDRRLGFSCQFEAHQQASNQPAIFVHGTTLGKFGYQIKLAFRDYQKIGAIIFIHVCTS